MSGNNLQQKAVSHANRAIQLDKSGIQNNDPKMYEEAAKEYRLAIQYYEVAMKYEKSTRMLELYEEKKQSFEKRVRILEDFLEERRKKSGTGSGRPSGDTAVASKRPDSDDVSDEGIDPDVEKLQNALEGAIVTETPKVRWSDVVGLEAAKDTLQEAVTLPKEHPYLFEGKREPWKGILLYGKLYPLFHKRNRLSRTRTPRSSQILRCCAIPRMRHPLY